MTKEYCLGSSDLLRYCDLDFVSDSVWYESVDFYAFDYLHLLCFVSSPNPWWHRPAHELRLYLSRNRCSCTAIQDWVHKDNEHSNTEESWAGNVERFKTYLFVYLDLMKRSRASQLVFVFQCWWNDAIHCGCWIQHICRLHGTTSTPRVFRFPSDQAFVDPSLSQEGVWYDPGGSYPPLFWTGTHLCIYILKSLLFITRRWAIHHSSWKLGQAQNSFRVPWHETISCGLQMNIRRIETVGFDIRDTFSIIWFRPTISALKPDIQTCVETGTATA